MSRCLLVAGEGVFRHVLRDNAGVLQIDGATGGLLQWLLTHLHADQLKVRRTYWKVVQAACDKSCTTAGPNYLCLPMCFRRCG